MTVETLFSHIQNPDNRVVDDIIKLGCAGMSTWSDLANDAYFNRVTLFLDDLNDRYANIINAYLDLKTNLDTRYTGNTNTSVVDNTSETTSNANSIGESVAVNSNDKTPYDLVNNIDTQTRSKNDANAENTSNSKKVDTLDYGKYERDYDIAQRKYRAVKLELCNAFKMKWLKGF